MKEPTQEAMNVIHKMMMKKGELTGVTSGLQGPGQLTWGFQRQEMIVLAARPSMGKTSLALNFAEAAALPKRGEPVPDLIFSLEMSAAQLALRMLCSRARVNMKLLREGLLSKNGDEQQRLVPRPTSSPRRRSSSTTPATCRSWSCAPRPAGSMPATSWV
jgi:replicative DNA helicase